MKVKITLALKGARHNFPYFHKAPLEQTSNGRLPGCKVNSREVSVDTTFLSRMFLVSQNQNTQLVYHLKAVVSIFYFVSPLQVLLFKTCVICVVFSAWQRMKFLMKVQHILQRP